MSFGHQSSGSESSQGLFGEQRMQFSQMLPGLYGQARQRADEAYADPGGLQYQGVVDTLLPTGRYGLPTAATEGVAQLGRDTFSRASAARFMRGGGSPYNLEGVLGDSMRMAAPTLLPLSSQFALAKAQMHPALRRAAFDFGIAPFEMANRAVSGSGSSTSSSEGLMMDLNSILKMGVSGVGAAGGTT